MSISAFFKIQCPICCSYCFLPTLKLYPVQQISVQFIFRSIIGLEFHVANFSESCTQNSEGFDIAGAQGIFFPEF